MAWEIERRFVARVEEDVWPRLGQGRRFRQGYLVAGDPSVRIRTGEERGAVLACKGGRGIRRTEFETVVSEQMARMLLVAAADRVIEKVRWRLGPWELDRFLGPLEGLTLLEIELGNEGDALPDAPEGVHVLREVTEDNRFISSVLATSSRAKQKELVKTAYQEGDPCSSSDA